MQMVLSIFLLYALFCLGYSWYQTQKKKNFFGLAPWLIPLGVFVYTDGVIFGLFWSIASIVLLIYKHAPLALLVFSLFWTVRSAGEIIYWLLEQFAGTKRNPPSTLLLYRFFPNESVYIVMQILWQCVLVVTLLLDIWIIKNL